MSNNSEILIIHNNAIQKNLKLKSRGEERRRLTLVLYSSILWLCVLKMLLFMSSVRLRQAALTLRRTYVVMCYVSNYKVKIVTPDPSLSPSLFIVVVFCLVPRRGRAGWALRCCRWTEVCVRVASLGKEVCVCVCVCVYVCPGLIRYHFLLHSLFSLSI